jgi:hypothetical protein
LNLSTTRDVTTTDVEDICSLRDDAYRNRWITYAYWSISQRLREQLIGNNASWCTFSTWSSRTIGENLRLDKATRRIEELIYDEQTSISPRDHSWLLRLQYQMSTRDNGAAQLALALGNRLIFHEIGYAVIRLLDWVAANPGSPLEEWQQYRATELQPYPEKDLFPLPRSGPEQLWTGLDCYLKAAQTQNDRDKAQLVLWGNVLLGAYEQERADPMLKVALEPFPDRFVRVVEANPDDPAALALPKGRTSWALQPASPLHRVVSELFGTLMTRGVMALDAPLFTWSIRPLRLGRRIPAPAAGANLYPPALRDLDDSALSELVGQHDRSRGTPAGTAAHNWTRFEDRMNYIVNLFRTGQQDMNLYRPLPETDLRTLDLDLSDTNLEKLRQTGDPRIDAWIRTRVEQEPIDPRSFVKRLVDKGLEELLEDDPSKPNLPEWADRAKLWHGQQFFRRYGLEVGAALFSASLPLSYTAARGATVLTTTSDLVSDARRRLAETGQMLLDAMASDDAALPPLGRDTWAYKSARAVRLFHGAVRHMMRTSSNNDLAEVPINQEDLLGTLAVFTVAVVEALDEMGVTCTVEDRDAYFHLWLVIGDILGVNYRLLFRKDRRRDEQPLSYAEMQLISRVILDRNADESVGGQRLMGALLEVSRDSMPSVFEGVHPALTRRLIGSRYAEMLDIPPGIFGRVVTATLRPLNSIISPYVRRNVLGAVTSGVTRKAYQWWITNGRGQRPPWRYSEANLPWLAPAHRRIRRRADDMVRRVPLVPQPTKERISGLVSPD